VIKENSSWCTKRRLKNVFDNYFAPKKELQRFLSFLCRLGHIQHSQNNPSAPDEFPMTSSDALSEFRKITRPHFFMKFELVFSISV